MRRILMVLILLAVAALWTGCGSDSTKAPSSNSTGTTTYDNSSPKTTTSAPSGGGMNSNAAPRGTPTPPGIKPPTDK